MKKFFYLMSLCLCMFMGASVLTSCGDDDEEVVNIDGNVKGIYTLDYKVTDYGNLDSSDKEAVKYIMENLICDDEWEDATLDEVTEDVKATINAQKRGVSETFYGKSFTVEIYIKNANKVTVKTITVKCNNGQLVY